jgi:hypothetical protein
VCNTGHQRKFKKYIYVPGELGRKKIKEIVHTRLDIKENDFLVKIILFQNTVYRYLLTKYEYIGTHNFQIWYQERIHNSFVWPYK